MTFKRSSIRQLLLTLALLGASLAAQALPIQSLSVAFDSVTPGANSSAPGVFGFTFDADGSEFTGLPCVTCTVTGIDWLQFPGRLWNSPSQVTVFDAVFSTGGELVSFLLKLRQDESTPVVAADGNTFRSGSVFGATITWDGTSGTTGGDGFTFGAIACKQSVDGQDTVCQQEKAQRFVSRPQTFDRVVVTPEPATPALLGLGLLAVGAARRRRG